METSHMTAAARAAALLAIALLVPACNLSFTNDVPVDLSPAPQNPFALQIPLNNANGVFPTNTQFAWGPMPDAVPGSLRLFAAGRHLAGVCKSGGDPPEPPREPGDLPHHPAAGDDVLLAGQRLEHAGMVDDAHRVVLDGSLRGVTRPRIGAER